MAITINTALLVSAAILQDYFSDNATDAAMSNGVITCYQDGARTTLKNWYYQTGSPGAYTYLPLNNPLTLSAAGTITDPNGNDTIPFWYPYSETDNVTPQPYYVTVDNSNGQRQFTRQNFPFIAPASVPGNVTPTLRNLIVNNVFWRNSGTQTLTFSASTPKNASGLFFQTICPSQHDGYISNMSDITFAKDQTGATDVAAFAQFNNINNRLTGDATPEFYLNMSCGNTGTSETIKYVQIPISLHVDNLSGFTNASVSIWTQNPLGASNAKITLTLFPFLGTGNVSPANNPIVSITPSTTWEQTIAPFNFNAPTLPTTPGDDAWFLQIGFPVGVTYNINIAKPAIYLSKTVPTNDFDTYEFVSSTIDAPRTGDIRTSLNAFQPYGWAPMNDGTIGNASSSAGSRANIDTWPLFSLIWNTFVQFNNAGTNLLAQMYNSAGVPIPYGTSDIMDFNNNNQLALTKLMGKVLLGGVPIANLQPFSKSTYVATADGSGNMLITTTTGMNLFNGMPIQFSNVGGTLPLPLVSSFTYYVANLVGTTQFNVSVSFPNAINGIVIPFGNAGTGTNTVTANNVGTVTGEYAHILLKKELPDPITNTANTFSVTGGAGSSVINSTTSYGGGIVSNNGGNQPHNVTQPGTFYNMFMKL